MADATSFFSQFCQPVNGQFITCYNNRWGAAFTSATAPKPGDALTWDGSKYIGVNLSAAITTAVSSEVATYVNANVQALVSAVVGDVVGPTVAAAIGSYNFTPMVLGILDSDQVIDVRNLRVNSLQLSFDQPLPQPLPLVVNEAGVATPQKLPPESLDLLPLDTDEPGLVRILRDGSYDVVPQSSSGGASYSLSQTEHKHPVTIPRRSVHEVLRPSQVGTPYGGFTLTNGPTATAGIALEIETECPKVLTIAFPVVDSSGPNSPYYDPNVVYWIVGTDTYGQDVFNGYKPPQFGGPGIPVAAAKPILKHYGVAKGTSTPPNIHAPSPLGYVFSGFPPMSSLSNPALIVSTGTIGLADSNLGANFIYLVRNKQVLAAQTGLGGANDYSFNMTLGTITFLSGASAPDGVAEYHVWYQTREQLTETGPALANVTLDTII